MPRQEKLQRHSAYCDHCGFRTRAPEYVASLPCNICSANEGESATLCSKCGHFIRHHPRSVST